MNQYYQLYPIYLIRRTWIVVLLHAMAIFAFTCFATLQVHAQTSFYYGVSAGGGASEKGYIFRFSDNIEDFEIVHDFEGQEQGAAPSGSLMQANDGWLYGTSEYGGILESGTLYRFNPINSNFEVVHMFSDSRHPWGDLVQTADGRIYGVTLAGGNIGPNGGDGGVIFSFDPQSLQYEMRHSFLSPDGEAEGYTAQKGLTMAPDGKFYGVCSNGGFFGHGTLFSFNPENNFFSTVHDFADGSDGRSPQCRLLLASDGDLYGTTPAAGPGNRGTIFRFNPELNHFSLIHSFSQAEANARGRNPQSYQLVETTPGVFYGTTTYGGAHNHGTLYRYSNGNIDSLMSFGGARPILGMSLMVLPNDHLLGYCNWQQEDLSGSVIYTFDLSVQGEDEVPFQVHSDSDGLPMAGLNFTRPILVNLTTLSANQHREPETDLLLYPNPASHRIYVPDVTHIDVFNLQGLRVYQGPVSAAGLDISHWNAGLYFITGIPAQGKQQSTSRFVKQ